MTYLTIASCKVKNLSLRIKCKIKIKKIEDKINIT